MQKGGRKMRHLKALGILVITVLILSISQKSEAASVKIGYGWSVNPDETKAVQEAVAMMQKNTVKPNLVVLLSEASYDRDDVIARELSKLTSGAKVFGLEGTYAVFTSDGIHVGEKGSLAILGIEAPSWKIGIGVTDMSDADTSLKIKEKAAQAIEDAIKDAGKTREDVPSLILLAPTKLKEEPILEAIEYIFGRNTKITGGTPGSPRVTANDKVVENGFVLAIIYADTKIGAGFHAGIIVDKDKSGIVTKMGTDRRTIKQINNRPAFEVYNEWTDGALKDIDPAKTPEIWARTYALVRVYDLAAGELGTKVVVPIKVNPDLSLITGADVSEGENLYFAHSTQKAFIKRAGTIVSKSLVDGKIKYTELAGGIHFYCRGAAFSQFGRDKNNLKVLVDETNTKMEGKPYIGTFTAGEQGNIAGFGCFMGNLTSAMVLFSED
jgi:hypothetical protein